MRKKIKIVCKYCGSNDVSKDAVARWNEDTQEWELSATFDKPNFCDNCDGETSLKEIEI